MIYGQKKDRRKGDLGGAGRQRDGRRRREERKREIEEG